MINKLKTGIKLYYTDNTHKVYFGEYDKILREGEDLQAIKKWRIGKFSAESNDKIRQTDGKIFIDFSLTVLCAEGVAGFGILYAYDTGEEFENTEYFMPSCWYGNNRLLMDGSNKFPFDGKIGGGAVDGISAPVVAAYVKRDKSCSYLVCGQTPMTTLADDGFSKKVLVDERLTVPSVGIRKIERMQTISLFYEYPGNTYHEQDYKFTTYRYRPAKLGANISGNFSVRVRCEEDFDGAFTSVWREIYDEIAVVNNDIDTDFARKALVDRVKRSAGVVNGVPQYMVFADHFVPESGFLYRNADMAYMMLLEGWRTDDRKTIDFALSVLDYQVEYRLAGQNQIFPFERSRAEGVQSVYSAWEFLKEQNIDKPKWLKFVKAEVSHFRKTDEFYSVPLLVRLGYIKDAEKKAEKIWSQNFSERLFFGGIVDFGGGKVCIDRESGLKGMEIMLSLYEATSEKKWLERAKACADYLETYENIQLFPYQTYGITGKEHYNVASLGNEHFKVNGISFISAGCRAGDIFHVAAIGLYYKLSRYLNDKHYYEFAVYVEQNSLQCIDLYNKAGKMSDYMYGSGLGFINEYYQLSNSGDPVGPSRGTAHNSDIAWCPFLFLYAWNQVKSLTGRYFLKENSRQEMYVNLSSFCNFSSKGEVYGDLNALADYDFHTAVKFEKDSVLEIDLSDKEADKIVLCGWTAYGEHDFEISFINKEGRCISQIKEYSEKLIYSHTIPQGTAMIRIVFFKSEILRQIQCFGNFDFRKICKINSESTAIASLYSPLGNDRVSYYLERDEKRYPLQYNNTTNEYQSDLEPYTCVKSADLYHTAKAYALVTEYRPESAGEFLLEILIRPYLFNGAQYPQSVFFSAEKDGTSLIDTEISFQKIQGERLTLKVHSDEKSIFRFILKSKNEDNTNCLLTNEILFLKGGKKNED